MESLHLALHGQNVGERLSAGTEVVVVSWTPKPNEDFEYWHDGNLVTGFEAYRSSTATAPSRTGSCARCGRRE
jgi:Family of unknown function (DUF6461)